MKIEKGYICDAGTILVDEHIPHGTLLDLINSYRLKVILSLFFCLLIRTL